MEDLDLEFENVFLGLDCNKPPLLARFDQDEAKLITSVGFKSMLSYLLFHVGLK